MDIPYVKMFYIVLPKDLIFRSTKTPPSELVSPQQTILRKKMKFSIKDFFSKCDQIPSFLVMFTEEVLNEKLHFLCSAIEG